MRCHLAAGSIPSILALTLTAVGQPGPSSPGSGPAGSGPAIPQIKVCTVEDLDAVRNNLNGAYFLCADIDLAGVEFEPIGSEATPFTGSFDGRGYAIRNFQRNAFGEDEVGLFRVAADGAFLHDLRLEQVDVTGSNRVGGLVGLLHMGASVTNCSVTGTLLGLEGVGGLVGRSHDATVSDCESWASVTSYVRWAGGVIGHVHPGCVVTGCAGHGDVLTWGHSAGGVAGNHHGSTMADCHADGIVTATDWGGGLVGYMQQEPGHETVIQGCGTTGALVVDPGNGQLLLPGPGHGGLVGLMEPSAEVIDCHAWDTVVDVTDSTSSVAGGLVGWTEPGSEIRDSSAIGSVTGHHHVGGLVGWANGDMEHSWAWVQVTGTFSLGGLAGNLDGATIFACQALGNVEATATGDSSSAGGLVGYVFPFSLIDSSYAAGTVTSQASDTGGLIGQCVNGSVRRSFALGPVTSSAPEVGGLIGMIRSNLEGASDVLIEDSFATGTVTFTGNAGPALAGGLIGRVHQVIAPIEIRHCYSIGSVQTSGHSGGGGLIGDREPVVTVTSCHWDIETSGTTESDGGEGHPTDEMWQQSTYGGWNFGTTWGIDEGMGYPFLLGLP